MSEIETPAQITKRWREEGRTFRPGDANDEMMRQGREALRARESAILEAVENGADDLVAFAEQIRDHREAGKYTTQG